MTIFLLTNNVEMTNAWITYFAACPDVYPLCEDFGIFMDENDVECVVSPANSFGLMDGGYDLAITNWFGDELQKSVQRYIVDNLYGEQIVGTSFIINTPKDGIRLIHTPTMRVPEPIIDETVVYNCMRSTLITALENGINSIVIPAFGASTGLLDPEVVAKMMWLAYKQVFTPNKEISWDIACETKLR